MVRPVFKDRESMQDGTRRPDPVCRAHCIILGITAVAAICGCTGVSASDASRGLVKAAICASCHGPAGISPVPGYPNIAGQNPLYLEYAMRRYRAGERSGEHAGMMFTVMQALSDDDISDLAAYFAALRPRP
jgi:cytochrome c553